VAEYSTRFLATARNDRNTRNDKHTPNDNHTQTDKTTQTDNPPPTFRPLITSTMTNTIVGIIGLGYVGLPLAITFGQKYQTIGFDVKNQAIENYRNKIDPNNEVDEAGFTAAKHLQFTTEAKDLHQADFIIVAVPTPIDAANQPDLHPLISASKTAGANMKKGATVIFESTVFPGATEDVCVPILEETSGLKWRQDFFVGYSPERINPGDKEHTLTTITKVVSGDTPATLRAVSALYSSIVTAGVFEASSIKEAEAAKVIENTQRDLNIALVNLGTTHYCGTQSTIYRAFQPGVC
jgi:UDP-N-acetyl-D-galactosamine dehydrogenase